MAETSRRQLMYERSLKGIKKIAFITDFTDACNWFFSFCALTWASAVLLGAYVENLGVWDFYDVSVLLFLEGLRFGVAALLRLLGYRLSDWHRWALRYVAFFIPLTMGGFALFSLLPGKAVYDFYPGRQPSLRHCTTEQNITSYASLCPSIYGFYGLILTNTLVFLLGSAITGLMRLRYIKPSVKSLTKYYDNMIHRRKSWLRPAADLNFAFKIQSSQYRRLEDKYTNGKVAAYYMCENYADLIWYLYLHEKGVEAAETALAADDGYVREAAAYIVGFWAVLDSLEEVKNCRLSLCFHRRMLSKLARIAAENYGSLGMAAAWSFGLLLESTEFEMINMVVCVRSEKGNKDLIDILLERAAELIIPPCPQAFHILQKYSQAHIYALRKYIQRLQDAMRGNRCEVTVTSKGIATSDLELQQTQLLEKLRAALSPAALNNIGILGEKDMSSISANEKGMMLQRFEQKLFDLLPPTANSDCYNNYYKEIWGALTKPPPKPQLYQLILHIALALTCLGVGSLLCLGVGKIFLQ